MTKKKQTTSDRTWKKVREVLETITSNLTRLDIRTMKSEDRADELSKQFNEVDKAIIDIDERLKLTCRHHLSYTRCKNLRHRGCIEVTCLACGAREDKWKHDFSKREWKALESLGLLDNNK